MMTILALSVFVSVIAAVLCRTTTPPTVTYWPTPEPITLSPRTIQLIQLCAERCKGESCVFPNPYDCRLFITCTNNEDTVMGYEEACPMGTSYDEAARTCVNAPDNRCVYDAACKKGPGFKSKYPDERCSTYTLCDDNGISVPQCCPPGFSFDESQQDCVGEYSCPLSDCPIRPPGICDDPTITTAPGASCGSYVNCLLGVAQEKCCGYGKSYSDEFKACISDSRCNEPCDSPPEKECEPGLKGYSTMPNFCGAYIQCKDGQPLKRRCCPYDQYYDDRMQQCEPLRPGADCDPRCPQKHLPPCDTFAVPGLKEWYQKKGAPPQKCANGTEFNADDCTCIKIANMEDNTCNVDLGLTFKLGDYETYGSQRETYIQEIGNGTYGAVNQDGIPSTKFHNYRLVLHVFQSEFRQFTLKIQFHPKGTSGKQILISNCQQSNQQSDPTLEIFLNRNELTLSFIAQGQKYTLAVQAWLNTWNEATIVYSGEEASVINKSERGTDSNTILANGVIPQANEPLNVAACDGGNQYTGSMGQLEIKRCVDEST